MLAIATFNASNCMTRTSLFCHDENEKIAIYFCILLAYSYLCSDMEFFQTLGKGIVQGFNQFITNDLESYIPLFIIAAVLIIAVLLRNSIHKHK